MAFPDFTGISLGDQGSFNGQEIFDVTSEFRRDISGDALDPNSANFIAQLGTAVDANGHGISSPSSITPNWGTGVGGPFGLAYTTIDSAATPLVPLYFWDQAIYAGNPPAYIVPDSDYNAAAGDVLGSPPYHWWIPPTAAVETGTDHLASLFTKTGYCLELFKPISNDNPQWVPPGSVYPLPTGAGAWTCTNVCLWDFHNQVFRPLFLTAAGASGMPYMALTIRYDEVFGQGVINHAVHFTINNAKALNKFVWPARHQAGQVDTPTKGPGDGPTHKVPFGARLRLKAAYDISTYTAGQQVILTALKKYGMILGDNSSTNNTQLVGTQDTRWGTNTSWKFNTPQLFVSDFEVVQLPTPYYTLTWVGGGSPQGPQDTASGQFMVAWDEAKAGAIGQIMNISPTASVVGTTFTSPTGGATNLAMSNTVRSKNFILHPPAGYNGPITVKAPGQRGAWPEPAGITYTVGLANPPVQAAYFSTLAFWAGGAAAGGSGAGGGGGGAHGGLLLKGVGK